MSTVPYQNRTYDNFLIHLAFVESSNDFTAINKYGYLGAFQMGDSALEDAGYKLDGRWLGTNGINSAQQFLNSPLEQIKAVKAYHRAITKILNREVLVLSNIMGNKLPNAHYISLSGIVAAAHLVGIGTVQKALRSDDPIKELSAARDGNKVSAMDYIKLFSGHY